MMMIDKEQELSYRDLMSVSNETHIEGIEIPQATSWQERQLFIFVLKTANMLMKLDCNFVD